MSDGESLRHVATEVRGRCWFVGAEEAPARGTLVGFHGYGENASRLLAEMRKIPGSAAWSIVSIQALHSFYTRSGRVVASWMTKLDRELAIADNLGYVAAVVEQFEVTEQLTRPYVYLGFSQGTAMAYRAAIASRRPADAVVALAGDVPPELSDAARSPFPPTLIGRGEEDSWYDASREEADVALLESRGAAIEVCRFAGGHEWTDAFRDACADFLERRS